MMCFHISHAQPTCINDSANVIMLNGDDWSALCDNIDNQYRSNSKFTIVHIGDSHLQPGIVSDEVRRLLQAHYGNGGRGLVCPLSLAGTNQPSDFSLRSSAGISSAGKLISQGRTPIKGMTGVHVKFNGGSTTLSIKTLHANDQFYRIVLFHSPGDHFDVSQQGRQLKAVDLSSYATSYVLSSLTDTARLQLNGYGFFYGMRLLNSKHGVVVDCIGNNGATYTSYNNIDNFGLQLKDLDPQLVIISLGTNEAYGRYTNLSTNIDRLVTAIKAANPNAKILLTTPLETQKKHNGGHTIQSGIAAVRDIIVNYGKTHNVAVWDFYTVGGGAGASAKWLDAGYMQSDRLHLKEKGYHLQGELLAKALLKLFQAQ